MKQDLKVFVINFLWMTISIRAFTEFYEFNTPNYFFGLVVGVIGTIVYNEIKGL